MKNLIIVFTLSLFISSCAYKERKRGHIIHPTQKEDVKRALVKEDVMDKIGSPSIKTMYGDEIWIYTYSELKQWAFLLPKEKDFEMLVIKFNGDRVKSMKFYDKSIKNKIDIAKDTTPVPGEVELGFFQELFGNIGRYTPAALDGGM